MRAARVRKAKAPRHAPAHSLPRTKRPLIRAIPLPRVARHRLGTAGVRRLATELRQWPVPAEGAGLPAVDDMLATRSVWQRGARLPLTPAFGTAAAAYVVWALIVVGFAPENLRTDQVAPARDADSGQLNAPRRDANAIQRVAPHRVPGNEEPVFAPPAEQVDAEFFSRLQSVVNGIEGQPGQPRPYQPDPIQPVIEPAPAPVPDPLAPVPPDVTPSPVLLPDGQVAEAPPSGPPLPPMPAVAPEAPASPAVVTSSGQAPESAGQQALGPPPGPAA